MELNAAVDLFKATPIQTKDTVSQQTPSTSTQPDTNQNDDNNQHSVVPTNLIPTLHLENVTELTDNTIFMKTTLAVADLNPENDSSETSVIDDKNTSYYFKRPRQNTLQSFLNFTQYNQVRVKLIYHLQMRIGYFSEAMVSIGIGCHTVKNLKLCFAQYA